MLRRDNPAFGLSKKLPCVLRISGTWQSRYQCYLETADYQECAGETLSERRNAVFIRRDVIFHAANFVVEHPFMPADIGNIRPQTRLFCLRNGALTFFGAEDDVEYILGVGVGQGATSSGGDILRGERMRGNIAAARFVNCLHISVVRDRSGSRLRRCWCRAAGALHHRLPPTQRLRVGLTSRRALRLRSGQALRRSAFRLIHELGSEETT